MEGNKLNLYIVGLYDIKEPADCCNDDCGIACNITD